MPQNPIQFQPGLSLSEFIERYGTEAQCAAAFERARWPSGFRCPECGAAEHSTFVADGRKYWQCARCRTQTTVRSGTLFHASKLPLNKWFLTIYLVTQNKNNISALSLKRHLGVCYRTAWRITHKLLEAMAEREARRKLTGVVMADDAYLGRVHAGKPGHGSQNKAPFVAAVELNDEGNPQRVRFDAIEDLKGATLARWATTALDCDVHLVTDGLSSFAAAGAVVAEQGSIIVSPRQSSDLEVFRWVNTFISNLKTAIRGTYHHFDLRTTLTENCVLAEESIDADQSTLANLQSFSGQDGFSASRINETPCHHWARRQFRISRVRKCQKRFQDQFLRGN